MRQAGQKRKRKTVLSREALKAAALHSGDSGSDGSGDSSADEFRASTQPTPSSSGWGHRAHAKNVFFFVLNGAVLSYVMTCRTADPDELR